MFTLRNKSGGILHPRLYMAIRNLIEGRHETEAEIIEKELRGVNGCVLVYGAHECGHRIGVIEEDHVRAASFHLAADIHVGLNGAQAHHHAARAAGITHHTLNAVLGRNGNIRTVIMGGGNIAGNTRPAAAD